LPATSKFAALFSSEQYLFGFLQSLIDWSMMAKSCLSIAKCCKPLGVADLDKEFAQKAIDAGSKVCFSFTIEFALLCNS
jgi:hypothetical protein